MEEEEEIYFENGEEVFVYAWIIVSPSIPPSSVIIVGNPACVRVCVFRPDPFEGRPNGGGRSVITREWGTLSVGPKKLNQKSTTV